VAILLVAIDGYSISGYWWLLMPILLMAFGGYQCLFYYWLLVATNAYFINGY
jgi:hypothetical protein